MTTLDLCPIGGHHWQTPVGPNAVTFCRLCGYAPGYTPTAHVDASIGTVTIDERTARMIVTLDVLVAAGLIERTDVWDRAPSDPNRVTVYYEDEEHPDDAPRLLIWTGPA